MFTRLIEPYTRAVNAAHAATIRDAQKAVSAAVRCGVLIMRARNFICESDAEFRDWISRHCDFSRATAYRYVALAERSLPPETLQQLLLDQRLEEPDKFWELPEPVPETQGLALTQLYRKLGIIAPPKAGGARTGAGRKRNDESDISAAAMIDGAVLRIATAIRDLGGHPIGEQDAGRIRAAATQLRELLAEISGLLREGI